MPASGTLSPSTAVQHSRQLSERKAEVPNPIEALLGVTLGATGNASKNQAFAALQRARLCTWYPEHLRPFFPTCLIAAEMKFSKRLRDAFRGPVPAVWCPHAPAQKFCGECGARLQPGPSSRQLASEHQVEHGASPSCRHRVGVSAQVIFRSPKITTSAGSTTRCFTGIRAQLSTSSPTCR